MMTALVLTITESKQKMLIAMRHLKKVFPQLNLNLLTQGDFKDLVREFNMSKERDELLGSRLKVWNLLHQGN